MPWRRESSRRVKAAPGQPARFSGTSVWESPFSSKTWGILLPGSHLVICCFRAPHLKRNTLHDAENERRESVPVLPGVAHDLANGRRVVVLDPSPQRERQKVFRQSCDKQFGTAQQGLL